ncbi:MAG TPA: alpha/beta hydrolase fold domain-containing protein [Acidimicrobiales bacterium]
MTLTPADAVDIIQLWPDGQPTRIEGVPPEVEFPVPYGIAENTTFLRNISDPTLTVFAPQGSSNGLGIIVVPGGGWTINAWTHEGLDVADWLTSLGYTAFLLKYRVQASDADQDAFMAQQAALDAGLAAGLSAGFKPTAISDLIPSAGEVISADKYIEAREACADDGRKAIQSVREQAERFGVKAAKVGMIGFSAGAFLIVDVALDPRAEQVAFIAPIYGGETRGAPVPEDAPPLFAAAAQDDILIKIVEGVHADWTAAGRSSELHVFARGAHGFGMVKQGMPSDHWTELFSAWLDDLNLTGS